jgi:hypothetical protein
MARVCKVAICIVTFRRPEGLRRLLRSIAGQRFQKVRRPEITVIVVDNDAARTARQVCERSRADLALRLIYHHEPAQGIPLARNAALGCVPADVDHIAWIDDDEVASTGWLAALIACIEETGADHATGPVTPLIPEQAPDWIVTGGFFERCNLPDRAEVRSVATNNVLMSAEAWRRSGLRFDERLRYTGSSDTLFFLHGRHFGWQTRWAAQAVVFEIEPPSRLTARWIIARQFRTGNGLAVCDRIANGNFRSLLTRMAKTVIYVAAGLAELLMSPFGGRVTAVRGLGKLARAAGTAWGLLGHRFEAYAPSRVAAEREPRGGEVVAFPVSRADKPVTAGSIRDGHRRETRLAPIHEHDGQPARHDRRDADERQRVRQFAKDDHA